MFTPQLVEVLLDDAITHVDKESSALALTDTQELLLCQQKTASIIQELIVLGKGAALNWSSPLKEKLKVLIEKRQKNIELLLEQKNQVQSKLEALDYMQKPMHKSQSMYGTYSPHTEYSSRFSTSA
jgi:hypothetical protein